MPFGNRNKFLQDFFSSVLPHLKKILPLWEPEIYLYTHFPKLKIAYFYGFFFNFS